MLAELRQIVMEMQELIPSWLILLQQKVDLVQCILQQVLNMMEDQGEVLVVD